MEGGITHQGDLGPQYLAAVIVNFLSFVYGLAIGWLAPTQPQIQAPENATNITSFWNTAVHGVSDESISWIGGIFSIGGVIGTPIYGYTANTLGRKLTLILAAVPFAITFFLNTIATSTTYLYIGRFIGGMGGGGVCCIIPMYIGEIVDDRVRGVLNSYFNLFICVGILGGYIIGSYTAYTFFALFCLGSTIIFFILAVWLPESPVYSLINDRPDEAFRSLTKLRGNNRELVQHQVNTISNTVKEMTSGANSSMSLKEMLEDRATRKGLIIALTTVSVQQASGIAPILNYTVAIFEASGSTMSPTIAAIVVGSLQIVGALLGTFFMERAGRKLLLMISNIGMSITLAPIAYFLYLKSHGADPEMLKSIGWLPVTALAVYMVVFGLGIGPVPFVLISELFKTEAKSIATSICVSNLWFMSFLFIKFFSNISDALGIETCFGLFSVFCAGGAVFTFFYIIETKGKSLETILEELGGYPITSSRKFENCDDISQTKT